MLANPQPPRLHLPKDWQDCVKSAVLHAIALAYYAIVYARAWVYLAVVIDLYSRRVVGWAMDRRMKKALVIRALLMAINLRQPPPGLQHHSDRGSQYASHAYQALLKQHGMICSMSRKGTG